MAFVNPNAPNLADFITFCREQGLTTTDLPDASEYFTWAFTFADDVTISVPQMPAILYVIAVYNLGFHHLLMIASDTSGLGLTSLVWASGQVTATTTAALTATAGTTLTVAVSGSVPLAYNGTYSAVVTGANTFVYAVQNDPGTATQVGTYGTVFFSTLRTKYNLLAFSAGPISGSGDQGTYENTLNPEFFKYLTFSDLNLMLTPWGRNYLSYAQCFGPTVVGLS